MAKKLAASKPAERLLKLYATLLFSKRPHSLSELAREFHCSKPSITRDIDKLESVPYGKVVRDRIGREVLYSMERPEKIPAVCLNAEGLFQLAMCRDVLLALLPAKIKEDIETTLCQAAACLPKGSQYLPEGIGAFVSKGRIDYAPFEGILKTLQKAIVEKLVCSVRYQASLQKPEKEYDFAPKRLLAFHECMYIEGYLVTDRGRALPRHADTVKLALQRFKSCVLTRRTSKFVPEIKEDATQSFGVMEGEPFSAAVRFAPKVATYISERQWSKDQKIDKNDDGSVTLQITANNEEEFINWILSFGEFAEIKEPDWLRSKMSNTVTNIVKKYV